MEERKRNKEPIPAPSMEQPQNNPPEESIEDVMQESSISQANSQVQHYANAQQHSDYFGDIEEVKMTPFFPKRQPRDSFVMQAKGDNDALDYILPLRKIGIEAIIEGAFTTVYLDITYLNPGDSNLEAIYEFPLDKKTLVAELTATINDKTVKAIVKDKEEAKQKYEDAIASGNAAIFA